jgi:Meiotically up-regulated gene 113
MREHIVDEIRRIAKANGGRPPGRRLFELETGIRTSEWYGVIWARWGDALAEAGFEPNQKQGKLSRQFLLEKCAQAFRHYGKAPTAIEMRMYSRLDPEFPSHTTIGNHFRGIANMIEELREWLAEREDYADVADLLPNPPTVSDMKPERIREQPVRHVYLIQSGNYYKIGRSDELERRVKEIRIALPEAAKLVHAIRTDDPAGIEAYWHRRFVHRRAHGEWFKLTAQDVSAFRRRKFQ